MWGNFQEFFSSYGTYTNTLEGKPLEVRNEETFRKSSDLSTFKFALIRDVPLQRPERTNSDNVAWILGIWESCWNLLTSSVRDASWSHTVSKTWKAFTVLGFLLNMWDLVTERNPNYVRWGKVVVLNIFMFTLGSHGRERFHESKKCWNITIKLHCPSAFNKHKAIRIYWETACMGCENCFPLF